MALAEIQAPNALPTVQDDYVKQNNLIDAQGLSLAGVVYPIDFTNNKIPQGTVLNIGGTILKAVNDESITGTPSKYVKIDKTLLTAAYVSSLAGVTWNAVYNHYQDGVGNLYIFDEGLAAHDNIVTDPRTTQASVRGLWVRDSLTVGVRVKKATAHIQEGSGSGITSISSHANTLMLDGDFNTGVTIASGDSYSSRIVFASPSDNVGSLINWNYNSKLFGIGSATSGGITAIYYDNNDEGLRIDSDGRISTYGLTLTEANPGGLQIFDNGSGTYDSIKLYGASVSVPFTAVDQRSFMSIGMGNVTDAWPTILGKSGASGSGLYLLGLNGQTSPTNGAIVLDGQKSDGAGGSTALADGELLIRFRNNGVNKIIFTGGGSIWTGGETAGDCDIGGITVYHTSDGKAVTIKNPSSAHPFNTTTYAESDTYLLFKKRNPTNGGAKIQCFSNNDTEALLIEPLIGTNSPTKAAMIIDAGKLNLSDGATTLDSDEKILEYRNYGNNVFTLFGNGDTIIDGVLSTNGNTSWEVDIGGINIDQGTGSGKSFVIKNGNMTAPFTDFAGDEVYFHIAKVDNSDGGSILRGISESNITAMRIDGWIGSTTPTVAAVILRANKSDGSTGIASLSATEKVTAIYNSSTEIAYFEGNGDLVLDGGIYTSLPSVFDDNVTINTGNTVIIASNTTINADLDVNGDLTIGSNDDVFLSVTSRMYTGGETTSGDIDNGGIMLKAQSGSLTQVLSGKDPTMGHGMTTLAETDTTFIISMDDIFGMELDCFSEDESSFYLQGHCTNGDTTVGTSAIGPIVLAGRKKSGTTSGSMGSSDNLLVVRDNFNTRFIVNASGSIYTDSSGGAGGIGPATVKYYDNENDILLAEAARKIIGNQTISAGLKPYKKRLEKLGIIINGFVGHTEMMALNLGLGSQLYNMIRGLSKKLGISEDELYNMALEY